MKKTKDSIFRLSAILAVVVLVTGCRTSESPTENTKSDVGTGAAVPITKEVQANMTPEQALAELKAGNERFVAGQPRLRHPLADVKAAAAGQYPIAIVLSCIDSRQPVETVLDQGIGDIFSARVAGNVLNEDMLGSMEFACQVSGAKLIVVLGHSNCGAIKGAVDQFQLGNLTELLARIQPAIDQIPDDGQARNSKNHDFVEKVAEANVRLVMQQIRDRSPVLRRLLEQGKIGLAGGMYDLSTGKVEFFSR